MEYVLFENRLLPMLFVPAISAQFQRYIQAVAYGHMGVYNGKLENCPQAFLKNNFIAFL